MILAWLLGSPSVSAPQDLTVAVASNFILPFEELSRTFRQRRSTRVKATFTSTGNLYAQIKNGAPYELFLAADQARPRLLHENGLAEEPFTYAKGRVVLWSSKDTLCMTGRWDAVLRNAGISRLAIANPETAPYGVASVEAMKRAGLWGAVKERLVFAQTVAQAFQYAHAETVDASFCALSAVFSEQGKKGCYWVIQEAPEIIQAACILKGGGNSAVVREFAAFLGSAEARVIKGKYGYE